MTLNKAFNEKEMLLHMTEGEGMLGNWFSLLTKTSLEVENTDSMFHSAKKALDVIYSNLLIDGEFEGWKEKSLPEVITQTRS